MKDRAKANFLVLFLVLSGAVTMSACFSGVACQPEGGSAFKIGKPLLHAAATGTSSCASTSTSTCTSGLTPSNVLYTVDPSGNILEYAISSTDGSLTLMCQPTAIKTAADAQLVVSNNSSFLYAFDPAGSQISGFVIGHAASEGSLTPITGVAPFMITSPQGAALSTAGLTFLQADPLGRFLFINDFNNSLVYVFTINASTGAIAAATNSPFSGLASSPTFVAVDNSGSFMFAADPKDGEISILNVSATTGALNKNANSPFLIASGTADFPHFVVVHPSKSILYSANNTSITAYTFDASGALQIVPGTPVSTQTIEPGMLAIDSTAAFIYSTDASTGNSGIIGNTIDPTTGAVSQSLVPNAPYAPIASALLNTVNLNLVTNPAGPNLYSLQIPPTSTTGGVVDNYPITISSGQLTPPTTQSTLAANNNMVVASVK